MDLVQVLVTQDIFVAIAAAGAFAGLPALADQWFQTAYATTNSNFTGSPNVRFVTKTLSPHVHTPAVVTISTTVTPVPVTSISTITTTNTEWLTETTTERLTEIVVSVITGTTEWHPGPSFTPSNTVSPTLPFADSGDAVDSSTVFLTTNLALDWLHYFLTVLAFIFFSLLFELWRRNGFRTDALTTVRVGSPRWRKHVKGRQDADKKAAMASQEKEEAEKSLQKERLERTDIQRQLSYARTAIQRLTQCNPDEITGADNDQALEILLETTEHARKEDVRQEYMEGLEKRRNLEKMNIEQAERITTLENDLKNALNSSLWWRVATEKDQQIERLEAAPKEREMMMEHLQAKVKYCEENHNQEEEKDNEFKRSKENWEKEKNALEGKILTLKIERQMPQNNAYTDTIRELDNEMKSLKTELADHKCPSGVSTALSETNAELTKQLGEANERVLTLQRRLQKQKSTSSGDKNVTSTDDTLIQGIQRDTGNDIHKLHETIAQKDWIITQKVEEYNALVVKAEEEFKTKNHQISSLQSKATRDEKEYNLMVTLSDKNKEILSLKADIHAKVQTITDLEANIFSKIQEITKLETEAKVEATKKDHDSTERHDLQVQNQQFRAERDQLHAQAQILQAQINEKTKALQEFQKNADETFSSHKRNWDAECTALRKELDKLRQEQSAPSQDVDSNLKKALEEASQWKEYGNQQRQTKNEALDAKDKEISKLEADLKKRNKRIQAAIDHMNQMVTDNRDISLFKAQNSIVEELTGQQLEPLDSQDRLLVSSADKKELEDLREKVASWGPELRIMSEEAVADMEIIKKLTNKNEDLEIELELLRNNSSDMRGFFTSMEMLLEQLEELLKSDSNVGFNVDALIKNIQTALARIKTFKR